jgi:hypothetical protein
MSTHKQLRRSEFQACQTVLKDRNKVEPLPRQKLTQANDHTTVTRFLKQAEYTIKTISNQSLLKWTPKPQKPNVFQGKF